MIRFLTEKKSKKNFKYNLVNDRESAKNNDKGDKTCESTA